MRNRTSLSSNVLFISTITIVGCNGIIAPTPTVSMTDTSADDASVIKDDGGVGSWWTTCTDGTRNGNETDVDCGGDCSPCGADKMCLHARDCVSGDCLNNRCIGPVAVDMTVLPDMTIIRAPNGDACANDDGCATGRCINFVCQRTLVVSVDPAKYAAQCPGGDVFPLAFDQTGNRVDQDVRPDMISVEGWVHGTTVEVGVRCGQQWFFLPRQSLTARQAGFAFELDRKEISDSVLLSPDRLDPWSARACKISPQDPNCSWKFGIQL